LTQERDRRDNGISRREFEAVISPIREDIKGVRRELERVEQRIATSDELRRIESLVNNSIGQWHTSNAVFAAQQHVLENKIAFAQGAVAILAFLIGSGILVCVVYFVIKG